MTKLQGKVKDAGGDNAEEEEEEEVDDAIDCNHRVTPRPILVLQHILSK